MNENDDHSRFTIRDEEAAPDSLYVADAENLRIEKLSTRITLVAVLIPCLLVIILGIAYLDIKNRVINTQNTGSMGVQNLSKDLESRFSNLSLKQARLEQQIAEASQAVETATAALQVNLKKTSTDLLRKLDALTKKVDAKPDPSTLTDLSRKTENTMADLQNDLATLNAAFDKFDDELADQILLMADSLKRDQDRIAEISNKIKNLEVEKLSKASMELTLGIERLALQEMVKDKLREMERKVADMDKQIARLSKRMDSQASSTPPSSPQTSTPPPEATPSAGSATITEQTIN
jgi:chromosome segregation ATPase